MSPQTAKYARTDEWVHLAGDVATVGISDFAVGALTDLVYLDLPAPGRTLQAGEPFGVVESVKAAEALARRVRQCLPTLPSAQRQVLVLRDFEGVEAAEVCDLLGVSPGNQRVLLHRARARLRGLLEDELGGT